MLSLFAPLLFLIQDTLAAPVKDVAAAATVGKIRGVADPVYHLYLQANSKNGTLTFFALIFFPFPLQSNLLMRVASIPVLGPESAADEFTIGSTIQSKKTSQYLNIATASTSYKPLVWGKTGDTTAWGLEGDTIITVQGSSYGRREYIRMLVDGHERCRKKRTGWLREFY
jgi:carbonyl reductase 1